MLPPMLIFFELCLPKLGGLEAVLWRDVPSVVLEMSCSNHSDDDPGDVVVTVNGFSDFLTILIDAARASTVLVDAVE